MISSSSVCISVLVLGLGLYMYSPTSDPNLDLFSNIRGYFNTLFGIRNGRGKSLHGKLEDGIMTSYEELDGIGALVHRPASATDSALLPCIIYFHGGGWTSGSTDEYKDFTHHLSKISHYMVISVEYRLSPEFKFPVPFEDCLRAALFVLQNPDVLGISDDKIMLAGDDVGGNLALSVALNVTIDRPKLAANIRMVGMFYSPLQAFDFNLPSYSKYTNRVGFMGKEAIVKQFAFYLFGEANNTIVDMLMNNFHTTEEQKNSQLAEIFDMNLIPFSFREYLVPSANIDGRDIKISDIITNLILDIRVSPMLAPMEELERLPFTYFIAPGEDPLRDESFMLYGTLRDHDIIKNEHAFYRLEKHGFLKDFKTNDIAAKAILDFTKSLKRILFSPRKRV